MLGHGRIYDIADDFILCDPFEIPDFWKVICGLDFGWDHPQAIAKLAYDQENDIIYVVNSWKAKEVSPNDAFGATQKWSKGVPMAWPMDGLQNERGPYSTVKIKSLYQDAGFKMLFEHATWPKGGVSVESGIYEIIDRMRKGKWKIFRGQPEYMDEHRQYHRDDKGNIVKVRDDILSAARYAYMMLRYAKYNKKAGGASFKEHVMPEPIAIIGITNQR